MDVSEKLGLSWDRCTSALDFNFDWHNLVKSPQPECSKWLILNTSTHFYLQDLVKSHLMSAVRSEVEELREKIAKLEVSLHWEHFWSITNNFWGVISCQTFSVQDTVQVLSRENDTLRNHVAPEVLNQLPNPAQRGLLGPQHLNSLPPPEPAHPALQPPQH